MISKKVKYECKGVVKDIGTNVINIDFNYGLNKYSIESIIHVDFDWHFVKDIIFKKVYIIFESNGNSYIFDIVDYDFKKKGIYPIIELKLELLESRFDELEDEEKDLNYKFG